MSAAPAQLPSDGTYEIDPTRSTVTFATRHLFGLARVKGTFTVHDGTITVATDDEESVDLVVGLRVDAASFDTGNDKRDTHVRSADFLDTEAHTFIEFNAASPATAFDGSSVDGMLRVTGTEEPVQVDVTEFAQTGDGVRVQGSVKINRYDFGLTQKKGMAGRDLTLTIDLVAPRSE